MSPRVESYRAGAAVSLVCGLLLGCSAYEIRHQIQWDSREQIWRSDASQVQLRSLQSRVFETSDRTRTLEAVVATFQDLDFQVPGPTNKFFYVYLIVSESRC